jgi:hypothetical protein
MNIRHFLADSLRALANRLAPPLPDLRQVAGPLEPERPAQVVVTLNGQAFQMPFEQALALNRGIEQWNIHLSKLAPIDCTPLPEKPQ